MQSSHQHTMIFCRAYALLYCNTRYAQQLNARIASTHYLHERWPQSFQKIIEIIRPELHEKGCKGDFLDAIMQSDSHGYKRGHVIVRITRNWKPVLLVFLQEVLDTLVKAKRRMRRRCLLVWPDISMPCNVVHCRQSLHHLGQFRGCFLRLEQAAHAPRGKHHTLTPWPKLTLGWMRNKTFVSEPKQKSLANQRIVVCIHVCCSNIVIRCEYCIRERNTDIFHVVACNGRTEYHGGSNGSSDRRSKGPGKGHAAGGNNQHCVYT